MKDSLRLRFTGAALGALIAGSFALLAVALTVEFVAWTLGVGAAIITGLGRWYTAPPPISAQPSQPAATAA